MLVNVVDVPPLCNFILPAIVRTGPLAIAISTAGASPALAKRMKRQIAEEYGSPYARLAVLLNEVRGLGEGHAADLPGPQGVLRGHRQRRAGSIDLLRAGDEARVRELIRDAQAAHVPATA
jgi:siroheme synthase (precorrin-2 oxidase/ferrochelatase)